MKNLLVAASAILAMATTNPAFASNLNVEKKIVGYGDLNLASIKGRQQLDSRITRAARAVCNVGEDRRLSAISAAQECYAKAIKGAKLELASRGITTQLASR